MWNWWCEIVIRPLDTVLLCRLLFCISRHWKWMAPSFTKSMSGVLKFKNYVTFDWSEIFQWFNNVYDFDAIFNSHVAVISNCSNLFQIHSKHTMRQWFPCLSRIWCCCDRQTCFLVIWKHFCFILSTGTRIRIDSVMQPLSSSSERNTSPSVTVTVGKFVPLNSLRKKSKKFSVLIPCVAKKCKWDVKAE